MCENPAGDNLKHTRRSDKRSGTEDKHAAAGVWGRLLMDSEGFLKLGEVCEFGGGFDFRSEENLISEEENGGGSTKGAVAVVTAPPSSSCACPTCLLI